MPLFKEETYQKMGKATGEQIGGKNFLKLMDALESTMNALSISFDTKLWQHVPKLQKMIERLENEELTGKLYLEGCRLLDTMEKDSP